MKEKLKSLIQTDNSLAPLFLRLSLGAIFFAHGAQKLFGWFGGYGLTATAGFFEDKLGMAPGILWASLAAFGEFFGGLALIFGVLTRFQGVQLAVTMLVAGWTAHAGAFFLPAGFEYVLILGAASMALVFTGGGRFSVDRLIASKTN